MFLVVVRIKALSRKRMELSQTIASLLSSIRTEQGCRRCDFCQSVEDENQLLLLEEWETKENLVAHMQSEHFMVLRGAMTLLGEPHGGMSHAVFQPDEIGGFDRRGDS